MHVMRHQPGILPGIALRVVILAVDGVERIKRLTEHTITTQSAHEARLLVEVMLIRTAAVQEILIVGTLAQKFSHLGNTVVGQCVFQPLSHRLKSGILVVRQVVVLLQQVHAAFVKHRRYLHGIEGGLLVIHEALQHHVSQDRYARITHHTVRLIAHQVPYRQFTLLFKDMQECLGKVFLLLRMDECHQWMGCTIGVPERKRRVIGESPLMDLAVSTTIVACYVTEDGGCRHRMIEGRIKYGTRVIVVSINRNLTKLVVPGLVGSSHDLLEVPTWDLSLQVGLGIFYTHCRDSTFHKNGLRGILDGHHHDAVALLFFDFHWRGELRSKKDILASGPPFGVAEARNHRGAFLLNLAFQRMIPTDALIQIYTKHSPLHVSTKTVAVEAHPFGGRQFNKDIGFL